MFHMCFCCSVWSSVSSLSLLLLQFLFSCLAFTLLIMCEADKFQFWDAKLTEHVESLYGDLAVIVNACGAHGTDCTYPVGAEVVALSPYWIHGRNGQLKSAAVQCELAWKDDEGTGFPCNNTFHRGIIACIATFKKASNCVPQDRMSIF